MFGRVSTRTRSPSRCLSGGGANNRHSGGCCVRMGVASGSPRLQEPMEKAHKRRPRLGPERPLVPAKPVEERNDAAAVVARKTWLYIGEESFSFVRLQASRSKPYDPNGLGSQWPSRVNAPCCVALEPETLEPWSGKRRAKRLEVGGIGSTKLFGKQLGHLQRRVEHSLGNNSLWQRLRPACCSRTRGTAPHAAFTCEAPQSAEAEAIWGGPGGKILKQ